MNTNSVLVEYVGKKAQKVDNVADTGTVWNGEGDIQPVTLEAWGKLSRHPEVWRIAVTKNSGAAASGGLATASGSIPAEVKSQPSTSESTTAEIQPTTVLLGGGPVSHYLIDGKEVALGDIVSGAQQACELTAEQWNDLPETERDDLIAGYVEQLRTAGAQASSSIVAPTQKKARAPKDEVAKKQSRRGSGKNSAAAE